MREEYSYRYKSIIFFLLIAVLLTPAYTSLARYYTVNKNDVTFSINKVASVNLYNDNKDAVAANEFDWNMLTQNKEFYMTTYDSSDSITVRDNVVASIWIFVPDDTDETQEDNIGCGRLSIRINLPNESAKTYTATGEFLSSKTPMYKEKGAGWIYRFYDTEGSEVRWKIPGNQMYDTKVVITLLNADIDIDSIVGVQCKWEQEGDKLA